MGNHVCNREGKAGRSNGERPRLQSAAGREGLAPAGVHTQGRARLQLPGSGNREPRRGRSGRSAAPPGGGAHLRPLPAAAAAAAAGRPRSIYRLPKQRPSERRLLRPPAPRSASRSSPRPLLRSDTPFYTPSRPPLQPGPARAPSPRGLRRAFPAAPAAPSRRPAGVLGRRAARVGRQHGPFHSAFPPPPRGARAPGDAMEPRRSERHKGARGTMGAVSPWAPSARSGGSALRGGGRSSRRARLGQPPFSSPPLLPPPPRHGCCSHSPVRLPWSRRHRAAGLIRPALTWDTSSVLC